MNPLESLSTIPAAEWLALHGRALACGCGRVLHPDDERVAAADELVALAVPQLVRLGELALVADGVPDLPCECTSALSGAAATVLRLFDRAPAAHARDIDYETDAWLERAYACSHERARVISRMVPDELPLVLLVDASAKAAAEAVMALHRDRIGVPEDLVDALASLLVLYAAGATMDR